MLSRLPQRRLLARARLRQRSRPVRHLSALLNCFQSRATPSLAGRPSTSTMCPARRPFTAGRRIPRWVTSTSTTLPRVRGPAVMSATRYRRFKPGVSPPDRLNRRPTCTTTPTRTFTTCREIATTLTPPARYSSPLTMSTTHRSKLTISMSFHRTYYCQFQPVTRLLRRRCHCQFQPVTRLLRRRCHCQFQPVTRLLRRRCHCQFQPVTRLLRRRCHCQFQPVTRLLRRRCHCQFQPVTRPLRRRWWYRRMRTQTTPLSLLHRRRAASLRYHQSPLDAAVNRCSQRTCTQCRGRWLLRLAWPRTPQRN